MYYIVLGTAIGTPQCQKKLGTIVTRHGSEVMADAHGGGKMCLDRRTRSDFVHEFTRYFRRYVFRSFTSLQTVNYSIYIFNFPCFVLCMLLVSFVTGRLFLPRSSCTGRRCLLLPALLPLLSKLW